MADKRNIILIKKIMKIFGEPNEEEFSKDIERSKNFKSKSKSLNSILSKYGKKIINKETYKPMLEEIISFLLKRDDFPLIIDIYMNTIDDLAADCLRKHLILKKSKPKKMQEDDDSSNGYIKFGIYLSCLNDDDQYYHKFLKGMLKYFQLCFENDYLYQYLQQNYFKNTELSKSCLDNISSFVHSLNKILGDMRRVPSKESNNKQSSQEIDNNKMNEIKYKTLCIRAHVHENKDILNIYKKCNNNDEIIYEIEKLYKNNRKNSELLVLQDLVQDYLKIEKSEKYIKVLEKSIALKDTELYSNSKDIQELKENINGLLKTTNELEIKDKNKSKEINELKKKDEEKSKEIKELKKRVDFIEPIVNSLICRKAINYCICKILDKYKSRISITVTFNERNEPKYKISFLDSVNEVKKVDANDFLDTLFEKKKLYNADSHLEEKELPCFIPDIWDMVKKNINFEKKRIRRCL